MPMQSLALALLVALAVGGVAWALFFPALVGSGQSDKRRQNLMTSGKTGETSSAEERSKNRRGQVEESLKEMELKQRSADKPSLAVRIQQAGLDWSKNKYYVVSAVIGVVLALVLFAVAKTPIAALLGLFVGGFGIPPWMLSFLKKRRQKQFLNSFPEAVDVIVRGIKTGLPLLDCIKMIAREAQEPVAGEFRAIVERQAIGIPLGDACTQLFERTGLTEANFFGIVIAIQQKAGGNLSEALGNLSRVLRDRKKMRAKIQAMSMEAKASAGIIGALPIVVMVLVYITSPGYITLLFTEKTGNFLLLISAFWMSCGVFVMRKMINFDF
ncbi:bacterial type II secretion system protein F domain protein [Variibacter gotjawalensis]|uniref:Bacterial type II secretion system protein F domain protein n=1 Tax=Variibacter gotjawalensis TaxID=1333996 RepID=A0A0S3PPH5_9BRAD|nr:type II secretion system F family protein [Variibacter gotjawalensis]NIK48104.1 tight adherence protein B [Variibacter gotjawalensis]RZS49980.1 tight adherence protein B [Variibacter gotjawalensis]BAT57807.1 bacterial type II secretion system protein F domain protein [Variibacter gotjawalensis]